MEEGFLNGQDSSELDKRPATERWIPFRLLFSYVALRITFVILVDLGGVVGF